MKPLEEGLERILETAKMPDEDTPLGQFLSQSPSLRRDVQQSLELSQQIQRQFRVDPDLRDELAPSPGFYARVLARIEAEGIGQSFWSFFLDPVFAGRLVGASLALVAILMMAGLWVGSEEPEPLTADITVEAPYAEPVMGAVLVSNGNEFLMEESEDLDQDRGSALLELSVYEQ